MFNEMKMKYKTKLYCTIGAAEEAKLFMHMMLCSRKQEIGYMTTFQQQQ